MTSESELKRYWYHPESESYFTTTSDKEVEEMFGSLDGALCRAITKVEYDNGK